MSALGAVRYERAYHYCRHCHHGATPADAILHVDQAELTPAARELVALAGTLSSFAEASAKVLPKLTGVRESESTVERTTEAAGQALGERLAAKCSAALGRGSGRRMRASTRLAT